MSCNQTRNEFLFCVITFVFITGSYIVFKKAFAMFDSGKTGSIEKEKVRTILNTLGHTYDDSELHEMLDAEDVEGKKIVVAV